MADQLERTAIDQLQNRLSRQRLKRILHLLILGSFLLPFVTVKSCVGSESDGVSHTGIQILARNGGELLVAVPVLALILFAFSFRRRRLVNPVNAGLMSVGEAMLSALAVLMTWTSVGLAFMFSRVTMHVGFVTCVGAWIVLYLLATDVAVRWYSETRNGCREPPPPWGLVVGVSVVIVDIVTIWIGESEGALELLLGIFASLLVGVPLVVAAMIVAVRHRLRRQESG